MQTMSAGKSSSSFTTKKSPTLTSVQKMSVTLPAHSAGTGAGGAGASRWRWLQRQLLGYGRAG